MQKVEKEYEIEIRVSVKAENREEAEEKIIDAVSNSVEEYYIL